MAAPVAFLVSARPSRIYSACLSIATRCLCITQQLEMPASTAMKRWQAGDDYGTPLEPPDRETILSFFGALSCFNFFQVATTGRVSFTLVEMEFALKRDRCVLGPCVGFSLGVVLSGFGRIWGRWLRVR